MLIFRIKHFVKYLILDLHNKSFTKFCEKYSSNGFSGFDLKCLNKVLMY